MLKKNIELADNQHCTACRACMQVCPKKSISLKYDECDVVHAVISEENCIQCGLCKKVCHLEKDVFHKKSDEVYVAWSMDEDVRDSSASGGIASEIYHLLLNKEIHCYGTEFEINKGVFFKELHSAEDIDFVRNSKYVFSDTENCYSIIKKQLQCQEKVLFIGLPCQVAGLRTFLATYDNDNLTTVDIVCHGTCPFEYLDQHIRFIEKKKRKSADTVEFRCPDFGTAKYQFALKRDKKVFYHKGVYENDLYQIGYHKALIYRESCLNCKYARAERVGDLTIADFSGLGEVDRWNQRRDSVSMIIKSTEKGEKLLKQLVYENRIHMERRPSDEAFRYEKQLQEPSIPHSKRVIFINEYKKTHDFEKSAALALKENICRNTARKILHVDEIRAFISVMIPKNVKDIIKWFIYR